MSKNIVLVALLAISLVGCSGSPTSPDPIVTQPGPPVVSNPTPTTPTPTLVGQIIFATSGLGVCPNNCQGGTDIPSTLAGDILVKVSLAQKDPMQIEVTLYTGTVNNRTFKSREVMTTAVDPTDPTSGGKGSVSFKHDGTPVLVSLKNLSSVTLSGGAQIFNIPESR